MKSYCTLLFSLLISYSILAQGVSINLEVESHQITLGDQVNFKYIIEKDNSLNLRLPVFEGKLSEEIEIISSSVDSVSEDSKTTIQLNYLVTSFTLGNQLIPQIPFLIQTDFGTDTLFSQESYLEVAGVQLDTTGIRDIKTIEEEPITFKEAYPFGLAFILLLAIIVGILWLIANAKQKDRPEYEYKKPTEPAYVIALRDLDILKSQKLWQQNQVKEYYSRLTEIIRAYIEMHFELPALEQTTSEILKSFYDSKYRQIINRDDLEELLNLADLVKFAKGDPQPDENIKLLEIGYKFIKETKDVFKEEEEKEGQENSESFKNIKESK